MDWKRSFGVAVIFLLGAGVGWIAKKSKSEEEGGDLVAEQSNRGVSNRTGVGLTWSEFGDRDDPVSAEFKAAVGSMSQMLQLDPGNFAATLEGLMREGLTAEEKMQQSAMLSMASTEQAVAFYRFHKETSGLSSNEETKEWRNFLLIMGQRDAQGFLDLIEDDLLKGGEDCLASITHGWTITDPGAAVAWFNELSGEHPGQDRALRGIMYGLAQNDPENAIEVFNSLNPEDVNQVSINPFAISLIMHHGLGALDDWLATGPSQELAESVIAEGSYGSMRRPPDEFVPWAADKLEQFPSLVSGFDQMSKKWVRQNPKDSIEWMNEQALTNTPSSTGLGIMARQLCKNGHTKSVEKWLEKFPNAIGFEVVKQARDRVVGN